jgi:hypothetical protein
MWPPRRRRLAKAELMLNQLKRPVTNGQLILFSDGKNFSQDQKVLVQGVLATQQSRLQSPGLLCMEREKDVSKAPPVLGINTFKCNGALLSSVLYLINSSF